MDGFDIEKRSFNIYAWKFIVTIKQSFYYTTLWFWCVFSHGIYILQYFSCNWIVGVDSLPNSRLHFLNWLSAFKHLAPLYICYCFLKSCSEWRILSNITNNIGYSSHRNLKVNERVQMHLEKVYMHIDT